jgi:hypothetical protein
MPHSAAELEKDPYLRMLVLGSKGVGKTTTCVTSLVNTFGPGYVIECGNAESMAPAARRTKKFQYDIIKDERAMEEALKEARNGVKEGRYKWVIVDDYTVYAIWLEGACRDQSAAQNAGKPDGRRYWKEFKDRLCNTARRACDWRCHVVFIMHWMDAGGGEIEGQRAKAGPGIVPLISGSAREELPLAFNDVIFMQKDVEKDKKDRRVFLINPEGVWGPVSRSVEGTHVIDADFSVFMKMIEETDKAPVATKGTKR